MKNLPFLAFTFLLVLVLFLPTGTVTFSAVAEAAVNIRDSNLRSAIEAALGVASGAPITAGEMATLPRLEAQNANISDLTGLEHATNLTELYLGAEWVEVERNWRTSNSASNLLPLAGLTKLTRLDLRGNSISDLSPLAGLTNLTYLELWDNRISDLSPLAGLINLTELRLGGNSISNLLPVAELTNLATLLLQRNRISDLSPLAGLTNLTRLGVANNNISDLSPLAGLTNLAMLGLRRNRISDLSPLAGLTNLAKVVLMDNRISDLSSLAANLGFESGDTVKVQRNPLSYQSIHTHIPTLRNRGVTVEFDNRAPPPPINANGMVRPVYFLPSDRPVRPDRVAALRQLIKDAQQFFADEMDRHGFGRKTFTFETNKDGEPTVHQINGKFREEYYYKENLTDYSVWEEFLEHFDGADLQHVYFIVIDLSYEALNGGESGGLGGAIFYPTQGDIGFGPAGKAKLRHRHITMGEELLGGFALVPSHGRNFERLGLTLHELGHGFGLVHDFRKGGPSDYVMAFRRQNRLSRCAAEWLSVNRFFNTKSTFINERGEIQLLSSRTYSKDVMGFRFKVTDPDGLHQAQLLVPDILNDPRWAGWGPNRLFDCNRLSGKTGTVEYTVRTAELVDRITLQIIDVGGNITWATFPFQLDETVPAQDTIPKTLKIISGKDQEGLPETALENPFVVEVQDQFDKPFPGAQVTFSVANGGGMLSAITAITDSNGRAESTLTLGQIPGTNTVTVSVTGIQENETFSAEGIRIPKALEIISGNNQEGLPGAALENPFVVEVRDQTGKPLHGTQVTFSVTTGGGTLSAGNITTDANGRAESTLTLGPNPGTNTVEMSVVEIREKQTFTAEGMGMPKTLEIVSGGGQQGQPGTTLGAPFVVEVKDQADKPLADVEVMFSVTSGGGILSAESVTTNSNGRAKSILTLGPNPGTNTVTASVTEIQEVQTFTAGGVRIPKTLAIISGDDQEGLPGTALANSFVVEVLDDENRPVPGVEVTFSVTSGGGTLSVMTVTTDSNGRAKSTLTLGQNPGTNTVTVSVTGIQKEKTFSAEGVRIPKTLAIISGDDQEGLPGAALTHPLVVEVLDDESRPVPGVQVTFAVSSGGGTLGAGSVRTDANGRVESALTLGSEPGTNRVEVSVEGVSQTVTFNAEASLPPPVATSLSIISGSDQSGWIGEALASSFVIEVRDQYDKPMTGVTVTFAVTAGNGSLSATSAMTGANGRAESTLTLGSEPGTNSVDVSVEGISQTVTFNAEASLPLPVPTSLVIVSGGGQSGLVGEGLTSPFVVEVLDQYGSPLKGVGVTFSITSGSGSLSAATATTGANGRAESTLTLGSDAGTHSVEASVEGISQTVTFTAEADLPPPVATVLSIVSGDNQEGMIGEALPNPFVAKVRDQYDAPMEGVQVNFTVSAGGGSLSDTIVYTNDNGLAQSTLTLGQNTGRNTVTVSVTEIQELKTFTAEGIRIPLAFWIISGFDQKGVIGEALGKPFVVEVRDRAGEPLSGAQVMFSVTAGGGLLSGGSAVTDSNGRAESTLTLGPNPGRNTVTISVTGIAAEQSVSATAEPPPIPVDVNRDDVVNILDLVSVASALGDKGADLPADVNGDEVVSILDLVLVAGALGEAAAAPTVRYRDLEIVPTAARINEWLIEARALEGLDEVMERGILTLENLLAALTPKETALLPNYPNPFNPETWIPYRLSKDVQVTLAIFDVNGSVIRTIDLGYQPAAVYESREKAIYWAGRNDLGEPVASGLYFYTLTAGDYTATRKMLIGK